ncbi:phosphate ABC transporter permease subunit PstC [Rhizobium alvei]|uniref:Phosphate transport system permease protein n=1 Tax=Rhizobium alvei TaxID=1132659 RepID=A0ABT8YSJ1_9HYPH|nr:phosphate ABC transporter permease subunit PstC [Rhizobium alvei]MDO6966292.1 phosphate ABC transporter permease subunit PstC [Rhizobium alvei]
MGTSVFLLIIVLIGVAAYVLGRSRAIAVAAGDESKLHSRPGYFGSYSAILSLLPALLVLVIGMAIGSELVDRSLRNALPADVLSKPVEEQNVIFHMIQGMSGGIEKMTTEEKATAKADISTLKAILGSKGVPLAREPEPFMVDAAEIYSSNASNVRLSVGILSVAVALLGMFFALSRVSLTFRARNRVEHVVLAGLIISSTIAILTTVGIIGSLISETVRFFAVVPPLDFFFGTVWDPRFSAAGDANAHGQFGLIPLLLGTVYIALVAMLIATPIGLFAAIYMSEYASSRIRSIVKPLLEVLAGIPTIVYGFFALITIGPFFRDFSAQLWGALTGNYTNFIEAQSVLTAGFVMSIRLIPFVSSLSDDIITAVPRAMRDGSLGLGATRSETMKRVLLPAALPGIVGALLLTASRAIGETMIVVLAAGVAANLQFSPFQPMTTITVKIVNQLTGDLEFNSPQTLVAFALGITLFVITLILNVYALYIVRKYREQYE